MALSEKKDDRASDGGSDALVFALGEKFRFVLKFILSVHFFKFQFFFGRVRERKLKIRRKAENQSKLTLRLATLQLAETREPRLVRKREATRPVALETRCQKLELCEAAAARRRQAEWVGFPRGLRMPLITKRRSAVNGGAAVSLRLTKPLTSRESRLKKDLFHLSLSLTPLIFQKSQRAALLLLLLLSSTRAASS